MLAAPAGSSRSILIIRGPYEVAMVLGRGKLAKIEVALSSRAEFQVKLLGSGFGRIAPVAASTSALLPSFSAFSEFEMKDRMLQRIE